VVLEMESPVGLSDLGFSEVKVGVKKLVVETVEETVTEEMEGVMETEN
tara:strand:- start:220 stop:363 length:144 start_codon:yes stop_codon:yes gene_type:complete